jgi:putative ABC transport system permease protein
LSAIREFVSRFRSLFQSDPAARLDEEIAAHAELIAAEYEARGMPEAEARAAARRELGNVTALRQSYREQSGLPLLENMGLDLKYAVRTLRRNLTFTAACIATLTVGLGAMITVLCVVSAFFWKPLPYPHPDSLVVLRELDPGKGEWPFSGPDLLDLEARTRLLKGIAGYSYASLAMTGVDQPEAVPCAAVTPSFFPVLGMQPVAGVLFGSNDRQTVVISRQLWEREWHRDPHVLGRSLALAGTTYIVGGIADMPEDLLPGVQLLLPLIPTAGDSRSAHEIEVIARVQPQAQADLNRIAASIDRANPQTNAGWTFRVIPLSKYLVGASTSRMLWMVLAAVALLWLLACMNVAGLQLARNVSRRHEMGTRLALGASRGRLRAQVLTESLLLAAGGALFGTVVAQFAVGAIRAFAPASLPRLAQLQMDFATSLIATGCMALSTLFFGFAGRAPSYQGGREIDRRDRSRDLLVMAQVALASVLLVAATLLLQSFLRLRLVNPGFNPENILTVHVDLPAAAYNGAQRIRFFRTAQQELSFLPDVKSVGASNVIPFTGWGTANRFRLEDEPPAEYHSAAWRAVSPGFFQTLGVPLQRGRLFTDADTDEAQQSVIISESMAKQYWPDVDPIGRHLLWGKSHGSKTVIGVVGDMRDLAVDAPPVPMMFRPYAQLSDAPMTLLIRTRKDPVQAISDVRRQLGSIDHDVALEFLPLTDAMAHSIQRPKASSEALAAFAVLALITAASGLYGLISYRVNQRQQEIGVRMALGATAAAVGWDVQRRCLSLVICGATVGLMGALMISRLMVSVLYETKAAEPLTYAAVLLVFVLVALVASLGPALRAARMDPASALRHE